MRTNAGLLVTMASCAMGGLFGCGADNEETANATGSLVTDPFVGMTPREVAEIPPVAGLTVVDRATAILHVSTVYGRPNATYRWVLDAIYTASTAGGIKIGLSFPAGASCSMRGIGYLAGSTTWQNTNASIGSATSAAAGTSGTVGTSVLTYGSGVGDIGVQLSGRLATGASGGTVQVVYAQATSDATATIMRTGSFFTLERVG